LINTDPDFVQKYDVIVANNLSTAAVAKLSDACVKHNKVLVTLRSNGMLGIVRLYKAEHRVVEKKSDTVRWDLRLFDPWKELEDYCLAFDMEVCLLSLSFILLFFP
jgi:amyloid beta precursor protein binding protein 1